MGSSSSRPGLNPSQGRLNLRFNRFPRLSSLFTCSSGSSYAPLEMEDYPTQIPVKSSEHRDSISNMVQTPLEESGSICSTETGLSCTGTETGTSAESNNEAGGDLSIDGGSRDVEANDCRKCLTESKDLVVPQDAVSGCENKGSSRFCPESSISSPQGLEDSHRIPVENQLGEVMTVHSSGSDSALLDSELATLHSLREESIPSGLGFLVSNREQGHGDGGVLHVDVVSISSNIISDGGADTSNREARRNSRRLFWDAFSRHGSRRLNDSPSDDRNDVASQDRWLLDFSGDFFYDGAGGDSGYLSTSRIHSLNERRRHSRSEIWERLLGGHDENSQQTTFCPSGLHPDGTCSCDSLLLTDESSARASISRIVMLAEALFEVLDEIHRQPVSLSLSMVSLPAPESVVDSFPLRNHKKVDASKVGDTVDQCHICLAEYEEEEKIRVLPCQHEFHMSCVDKWLKEIHGVCPLCRGDVRQGMDSSVPNSEVPSL
ncbi:hypothetical protein V6Z12_D08G285800 [Gossypium hirsutum]